MYQKDYILRMIEMLGDLLRAIFASIKKGDYNQAEETINEVYLTMLRKDSAFFQQIEPEKLTTVLIEDHNYTNQHLEILAELLYAEANLILSKSSREESLPFFQKSLLLFEFVDNEFKTYDTERLNKISKIREIFNSLEH